MGKVDCDDGNDGCAGDRRRWSIAPSVYSLLSSHRFLLSSPFHFTLSLPNCESLVHTCTETNWNFLIFQFFLFNSLPMFACCVHSASFYLSLSLSLFLSLSISLSLSLSLFPSLTRSGQIGLRQRLSLTLSSLSLSISNSLSFPPPPLTELTVKVAVNLNLNIKGSTMSCP